MQNQLARHRLFRGLTDEESSLIEQSGEWLRLSKGRTVITEQRDNKTLYLVAEGSVDVKIADSVGANIQLASHGPGMIIGEYSFIDGLPAAASAVTASESLLFAIRHENLMQIIDRHDHIGKLIYGNLLGILVQRLREANAELDLFSA